MASDAIVLQNLEVEDNRTSSTNLNHSALPSVDKGFGAWSFLASAFCVEAIVWGFPTAYGTFLDAYLRDSRFTSQPRAQVLLPLIGQLSTGLMYCSGPLIYPLAARFPEYRRVSIWTGAAICGMSLLGASFTSSVGLLVILQGVLYGVGGALLYAPCISFVHEWFLERRGMANGIIFAGTGAGGVLLPLVMPSVIASVGPAKALRYMAICIMVLLIPLLPFYRGRLPQVRGSVQGPGPRGAHTRANPFKNTMFLAFLATNTVQAFAYFIPIVWLPTFASDLNLSAVKSSLSLALLNAASVVGRLSLGYLSDKFNPWSLGVSTLTLTALISFVLWGVASHTLAGVLSFGIAYGLVAGGWSCLFSGFIRRVAKEDITLSTTLYGYVLFSRGLGNVLSTPIASALLSSASISSYGDELAQTGFDVGGGRFKKMIIYVGSCFAGAAMIASLEWGRETMKCR